MRPTSRSLARTVVPGLALCLMLAAQPASAQEISTDGARALRDGLLSLLPRELPAADAISVRPNGSDYEITTDFLRLFGLDRIAGLELRGLAPILTYAAPRPDGLWSLRQNGALDFSGRYAANGVSNDFSYAAKSMSLDGTVDPSMFYFRSANARLTDMTFASRTPEETVAAHVAKADSVTTATKRDGGKVDVVTRTAISQLTETIEDRRTGAVVIGIADMKVDVAVDALMVRPLQDMLLLVLDGARNKQQDPALAARLKSLARASLPLFDTLTETIAAEKVSIATPAMSATLDRFAYAITANGLRNGARLGFAIDGAGLSLPPDLVPAPFVPLLPDTAAIRVALVDVAAADGLTYALDNVDFADPAPLTEPAKDEISRRFFPQGFVTVNFDGTRITSSVYDIALDGTLKALLAPDADPLVDVTLYARDFDRSVAWLQKNASATPEFGQAAFFVLMASGFARTAPDGRKMWHIEANGDGTVKVNGNRFPIPNTRSKP